MKRTLIITLGLIPLSFIACDDETNTEPETTNSAATEISNEALQEGKMGGSPNLDFSDVSSSSWPLIGYLYADDVYRAKYNAFVSETISGAFDPLTIQAKYAAFSTLGESYATAERNGYTFLNYSGEFQNAISSLNSHSNNRAAAVDNYLN